MVILCGVFLVLRFWNVLELELMGCYGGTGQQLEEKEEKEEE